MEKKTFIKGSIDGNKYYALTTYYPKGQRDKLDQDSVIISEFILGFKDPCDYEIFPRLVANLIMNTLDQEEVKNWTLSIIPASTFRKTRDRFEFFLNKVCSLIPVNNGFDIIKLTTNHRAMKGRQILNKIEFFKFAETKLPSNILLFDDIINTGETFRQCCKELTKLGVKNIIGIMLGKTPIRSKRVSKY